MVVIELFSRDFLFHVIIVLHVWDLTPEGRSFVDLTFLLGIGHKVPGSENDGTLFISVILLVIRLLLHVFVRGMNLFFNYFSWLEWEIMAGIFMTVFLGGSHGLECSILEWVPSGDVRWPREEHLIHLTHLVLSGVEVPWARNDISILRILIGSFHWEFISVTEGS